MGVAGLMFEPHPPNFENLYRVGNKFSDTLNVPFVSNWFMLVKIAVNCKF